MMTIVLPNIFNLTSRKKRPMLSFTVKPALSAAMFQNVLTVGT